MYNQIDVTKNSINENQPKLKRINRRTLSSSAELNLNISNINNYNNKNNINSSIISNNIISNDYSRNIKSPILIKKKFESLQEVILF